MTDPTSSPPDSDPPPCSVRWRTAVFRRAANRLYRKPPAPGVPPALRARALGAVLQRTAPTPAHGAVATDVARALARPAADDAAARARHAARPPGLGAEKIVSHRYRFVWLCVPKAASRSLMATLRDADPDAEVFNQVAARDLLRHRPATADYFTFAFVRHPYHRVYSFYADVLHRPHACRWFIDQYHGIAPGMAFDDLCAWLASPYGDDAFADRHWLSQHRQVRFAGRPPDFLGRCENIDTDFAEVARHLGLPQKTLPHLNAARRPHADPARRDAALAERNRERLYARYRADFALGGYTR